MITKQDEVSESVEVDVKKMDPQATVEKSIAMAAPPKKVEEEPEVQTLAELLGVTEPPLVFLLSSANVERGEEEFNFPSD